MSPPRPAPTSPRHLAHQRAALATFAILALITIAVLTAMISNVLSTPTPHLATPPPAGTTQPPPDTPTPTTPHPGDPPTMTTPPDLTTDTAAQHFVDQLPQDARDRLRNALLNTQAADTERVILAKIHTALQHNTPGRRDALGVLFTATKTDSEYHLDDTGLVLLADGTTQQIEFDLLTTFTEYYDDVVLPNDFTLTVDLRTATLTEDDTPGKTIYDRLGVTPR